MFDSTFAKARASLPSGRTRRPKVLYTCSRGALVLFLATAVLTVTACDRQEPSTDGDLSSDTSDRGPELVILSVVDPETSAPLSSATISVDGGGPLEWTGIPLNIDLGGGNRPQAVSLTVTASGFEAADHRFTVPPGVTIERTVEVGRRTQVASLETDPEDSPPSAPETPGEGGAVTPASPRPPAPAEPEVEHIVRIEVEPAGALVTLTDVSEGNRSFQTQSPGVLGVPPGLYSWSVSMDGFLTDRSTSLLDLETRSEAVIRAALTSIEAEEALRMGDEAMEQGDFFLAAEYYRSFPAPMDIESPVGRQYMIARSRLAEALVEQGESGEAAQVFRNMIDLNPREYSAFLGLARIQQADGQCVEARRNLLQVERLMNNVAPDRRSVVRAWTLYYHGLCSFSDFERASDPTSRQRAIPRAVQDFETFLAHVRGMPSLSPELESAREDIEERLNQVMETI